LTKKLSSTFDASLLAGFCTFLYVTLFAGVIGAVTVLNTVITCVYIICILYINYKEYRQNGMPQEFTFSNKVCVGSDRYKVKQSRTVPKLDESELFEGFRARLDRIPDNSIEFGVTSDTTLSRLNSTIQKDRQIDEELGEIINGCATKNKIETHAQGSIPPEGVQISHNVQWSSFENIEHQIDSSSCHIYTAMWDGKKVILKLIKADRVTSAVALSEFEAEVSVLSRTRHDHIVNFLGSGHVPRRFLVLEYLEGGTLANALGVRADNSSKKQKLMKIKFSYIQTLKFARSLATAMHYLHSEWHEQIVILHRDLKPDNIGFTADGIVKVFDFGLCATVRRPRRIDMNASRVAKIQAADCTANSAADNSSGNSSAGTNDSAVMIGSGTRPPLPPQTYVSVLGSPLAERRYERFAMTGNTGTLRYMAPEVALGHSYNQSIDVYSFGIIMWQIMKGKVPYETMSKKAYINRIVLGKERPKLESTWSQRMKRLMQQCWSDDSDRRPTFQQILVELNTLIRREEESRHVLQYVWHLYLRPHLSYAAPRGEPLSDELTVVSGAVEDISGRRDTARGRALSEIEISKALSSLPDDGTGVGAEDGYSTDVIVNQNYYFCCHPLTVAYLSTKKHFIFVLSIFLAALSSLMGYVGEILLGALVCYVAIFIFYIVILHLNFTEFFSFFTQCLSFACCVSRCEKDKDIVSLTNIESGRVGFSCDSDKSSSTGDGGPETDGVRGRLSGTRRVGFLERIKIFSIGSRTTSFQKVSTDNIDIAEITTRDGRNDSFRASGQDRECFDEVSLASVHQNPLHYN